MNRTPLFIAVLFLLACQFPHLLQAEHPDGILMDHHYEVLKFKTSADAEWTPAPRFYFMYFRGYLLAGYIEMNTCSSSHISYEVNESDSLGFESVVLHDNGYKICENDTDRVFEQAYFDLLPSLNHYSLKDDTLVFWGDNGEKVILHRIWTMKSRLQGTWFNPDDTTQLIEVKGDTWTYRTQGEPVDPRYVYDMEAANDVWMDGDWNLVIDWAKISNQYETIEYYFISCGERSMTFSVKDKSKYHDWLSKDFWDEQRRNNTELWQEREKEMAQAGVADLIGAEVEVIEQDHRSGSFSEEEEGEWGDDDWGDEGWEEGEPPEIDRSAMPRPRVHDSAPPSEDFENENLSGEEEMDVPPPPPPLPEKYGSGIMEEEIEPEDLDVNGYAEPTPERWDEPRQYYSPWVDSYSSRISVDRILPKVRSEDPVEPPPLYSANLVYWVKSKFSGEFNGERTAVLEIYNQKDVLLQIKIKEVYQNPPTVSWVNEKLLHVEWWWGRVLGAYLIYDVEQERILMQEMVHDGRLLWEQGR